MNLQTDIAKTLSSIVILFSLCTQFVHAQVVYKTIHPDGSVSFSDTPSEGAIKVDLANNKTNLIPSRTSSIKAPTLSINSKAKDVKPLPTLTITKPEQEATIRNNTGTVVIAAQLTPTYPGRYVLRVGDTVIESVNGQFTLTNMDRGEYGYQIEFLDNKGKVIAFSKKQRFYLHKNSIITSPLINRKASNKP